ncbi:MAG: hypothetical protein WBP79_04590 [Candidatus Acidiferrales bacterium]
MRPIQSQLLTAPRAILQTTNLPPMEWENELRELGDRVASISPPPARIDLVVTNLSTLAADEVAAIDDWLKTNLVRRRFQLAGAASAETSVHVTLSENVEGFLIVAEIRRGAAEQVAIFPVSKAARSAKRIGGVVLDEKLVWEQAETILDFILPPAPAGEAPTMIVLEPRRLVFYVRKQAQWQINQAVSLSPLRPWLRDPRGQIDISHGPAAGTVKLPGMECKGDFEHPSTIDCDYVDQSKQSWTPGNTPLPANLDLGGDSAGVSLECDGRPVVLATGKSDWTHPDFIQGYEIGTGRGHGAMASGNPVEFGGPVTSLTWMGTEGVARAVVENLQSKNYEAYIVTATCSH